LRRGRRGAHIKRRGARKRISRVTIRPAHGKDFLCFFPAGRGAFFRKEKTCFKNQTLAVFGLCPCGGGDPRDLFFSAIFLCFHESARGGPNCKTGRGFRKPFPPLFGRSFFLSHGEFLFFMGERTFGRSGTWKQSARPLNGLPNFSRFYCTLLGLSKKNQAPRAVFRRAREGGGGGRAAGGKPFAGK